MAQWRSGAVAQWRHVPADPEYTVADAGSLRSDKLGDDAFNRVGWMRGALGATRKVRIIRQYLFTAKLMLFCQYARLGPRKAIW